MGNIVSILFQVSFEAIFSYFLNWIAREAAYVSNLKDNINMLQTNKEKLMEVKNDVTRKVTVAEEQPEMIVKEQVQGWILRVESMAGEVEKLIIESGQEIEKLRLGGYSSENYKSSYEFGKRVATMLEKVKELTDEGSCFREVAENVANAPVVESPVEPTIVGLEAKLGETWRCMSKKEPRTIGIYGPGGVGKSTLLTLINNNFLNVSHDFDVVMMIVVSKDHQIGKIQDKIGERIGLSSESWKRKSVEEKSTLIYNVLKRKKFVLLLDDIWERVDLTKVGIPVSGTEPISKVVFTTRFVSICGQMGSQETIKVECLGSADAWTLFKENIQMDILESHSNIAKLAKHVAYKCGGLPLALVTVARAMACKKTQQEWKYAMQVLQSSASDFPGMGKEVYPLLKFSYDALPSDTIRSCFLYCCLFPEDYNISVTDLIDNWIGEGFLDEFKGSKVQNQGHDIVGVLLHACLLEEGEDENSVKMHDVIRDMALWIACDVENKNGKYSVYANAGLSDMPNIDNWKEVKRMSLMQNEIETLSKIPSCPGLSTLLVNFNFLESISPYFFQCMPSLKVLNLSYNS